MRLQGVGLGLRPRHYEYVLQQKPKIPWFEILLDNYLCAGGYPHRVLERICADYPVTFHCVGMSLGSTDRLDRVYFKRLKELIEQYQPVFVSDHLCWTSQQARRLHELMPMPYTEQAIQHLAGRIAQVQDLLGREILLENVSSYIRYKDSHMSEQEFYIRVVEQADCRMLLDINNIYVSAKNHCFDPIAYVNEIPIDRVQEMHLAGYEEQQGFLLDTHGEPVHQPVWDLYALAVRRFDEIPTLIEWDTEVPEFSILLAERAKAESINQRRNDATG